MRKNDILLQKETLTTIGYSSPVLSKNYFTRNLFYDKRSSWNSVPGKIGRNYPCPCGSGKKYKRCCLGNEEMTPSELLASSDRPMTNAQKLRDRPELLEMSDSLIGKHIPVGSFKDFISDLWSSDKVKMMGTPQIIEKLRSMNVDFDINNFKEHAQNYISACQLAHELYYTHDYRPGNYLDDDFIWLAIIELWNRIIPERYNVEMINDLMQDGYACIERSDYREGLEKWEKAWRIITSIIPPDVKSVSDADEYIYSITQAISMAQSIYNWCQDFQNELSEAASYDDSFNARLIKYCQDFRRVFPDSDELIIKNMLKAER
ncbi:MAG: YecA family protein [Rhabdochlamydiaceae bacterium]